MKLFSKPAASGWSIILAFHNHHDRMRCPKACTNRQIFTGSAMESAVKPADSDVESADFTANPIVVNRWSLLLSNMFKLFGTNWNWTSAIGQVDMGLKSYSAKVGSPFHLETEAKALHLASIGLP